MIVPDIHLITIVKINITNQAKFQPVQANTYFDISKKKLCCIIWIVFSVKKSTLIFIAPNLLRLFPYRKVHFFHCQVLGSGNRCASQGAHNNGRILAHFLVKIRDNGDKVRLLATQPSQHVVVIRWAQPFVDDVRIVILEGAVPQQKSGQSFVSGRVPLQKNGI